LDAKDPAAIDQLFDYITGVHKKTKICRPMLEKLIMSRGLALRVKELGRCTPQWPLTSPHLSAADLIS